MSKRIGSISNELTSGESIHNLTITVSFTGKWILCPLIKMDLKLKLSQICGYKEVS